MVIFITMLMSVSIFIIMLIVMPMSVSIFILVLILILMLMSVSLFIIIWLLVRYSSISPLGFDLLGSLLATIQEAATGQYAGNRVVRCFHFLLLANVEFGCR